MNKNLLERYMMFYFHAEQRRKSCMDRGDNLRAMFWAGRAEGIVDCIAELTKEPMSKLEERYSYLL